MTAKIKQAIALANEGHWDAAHSIVQRMNEPTAYWLHANLHREEGDHGNAQYWYSRADKPFGSGTFESERDQIMATLPVIGS